MTHARDMAKFLALKAIWEHKTKTAKDAIDRAESVEADFSVPFEEHNRRLDAAIKAARRALRSHQKAKNNLVSFMQAVAKRQRITSGEELRLYFDNANLFWLCVNEF